MIRLLRAFAWLRWRLLANGFRKSRRDALERVSRAAEIAVPVIVGLFAVPAALALTASAFIGGLLASSSETARIVLAIVPRALLAVLTFVTLVGPLLRSMQGSTLGLARLTLLPIPRGLLHIVEVVTGLADPWVLAVLPGLFALPLGLLASGSVAAAAVTLAAGVALAAFLASLSSSMSFVVALLLRGRRRGEWITLAFMALLSFAGFLPAVFSSLPGSHVAVERRVAARPDPAFLAWTRLVPSEMYGLALKRSIEGRPAGALAPLAGLAATGAGLFGLSWVAYRRLLETPAGSSARRQGELRGTRLARIPGLKPAASAVALAEARLVLRTVRGKTAIYFTPIAVGAIGWMGAGTVRADPAGASRLLASGAVVPCAAAIFSVIALQPFLFNQFATDRGGLALEFLSPVSDLDLVRGKAAAMFLLWGLTLLLSVLAGGIATRSMPLWAWGAAALASASMLALLAPAAAMLSALFPKPSDLGRIGRAGNPHPTAGILGTLLLLALGAPPAGLAALGLLMLKSPAVAIALLAGWAALAVAGGSALLRAAATVVARRRENLALVAQGR
ncbi:MAG: hypothetical protein LAO51_09015 [Acidobacteriia bacterium]|nr:hypothetical protein [Terriglobia bacterium]